MQNNMFKNSENIRLDIPKIMLGTFNVNNYTQMNNMIKTALENGCYAFDTSPSYGTEEMLGRALIENKELYKSREKIFISTKIDGIQMYETNGNIDEFVLESLKKLQIKYIDLLLVHWPFEKYLENTWKSMERLYEQGLVKSIGICNVNKRVMEKFKNRNIFKKYSPQVIQNEISPLRTCDEEIKYYKSNNLAVQAYSPLCRMNEEIKNSEILKSLVKKYNKNVGQIILRWHIDREIIPIFTSTKPERIKSNLDIFDFKLNNEDIELINSMNKNYKIFLESYGCPGI